MVSIDGYPVDLFVTEEHAFEADVTEHPVERGGVVTDNTRLKPPTLSLEGVVSDSPLGTVATDPSRTGSSLPSEDALAKLMQIRDAREPVVITTALRRYENMGLVSLSIPKSAGTGKALRFKASFKQITIVSNKRTTVKTAAPRSKKKTKRGLKPSAEDIERTKALLKEKGTLGVQKDKSMLLQGSQAAGSFFGL